MRRKPDLAEIAPWKLAVAGMAVGVVVFGTLGGALGYMIGSIPPRPIVIVLLPPAPPSTVVPP